MNQETADFVEKMKKAHAQLFLEAKNSITIEAPIATLSHDGAECAILIVPDAVVAVAGWKKIVETLISMVAVGGCFLITVAGPHREPATPVAKPKATISMKDLLAEIWKDSVWKGAAVEEDPTTGDLRFFGWRKRVAAAPAKTKKK